MRKIILSAGHSNQSGKNASGKTIDRGSAANGLIEGVETARMRKRIYDQLKLFGANVHRDPDNTVLADSLRIFREIAEDDSIMVDIHFNAATPKATGAETFVENYPTTEELELARDLNTTICDTLGIRDRGVKRESESQHKSGLGWMRLKGSNVLIEVCFITNPDDVERYTENFEALCCNIANVLYTYSKKEYIKSESFHVVKSGDSLSKIAAKYGTSIEKIKNDNKLSSNVIQIGWKLKI